MMMKVRNRQTGEIIEVPVFHYEGVLAKQGIYLPVEEKSNRRKKDEKEVEADSTQP